MQDTITPLVSKVAELKAQLAPLEAQMKPLVEELEITKIALMQAMQQSKSKRTEAVDGYYVVRAERKSFNITDPSAVDEWLGDNGFDLGEYYKLDSARVKAAAESASKTTVN
ncbi:hypothetical protein [Arthrobacter sp. NicSoilC5]|uniref:hypothetical protein n=1 Tax=Arthrobacter sp. NicSoilC5 TaxID=2831000 RepID=UPI001CC6C2F8|nr:hypothetical protein [Arthrobacter sp. NicSoilC5]BCW78303.1 hypothetical protein NicSoilC5_03220 [Arthrobacter sp. NicSoilC5]